MKRFGKGSELSSFLGGRFFFFKFLHNALLYFWISFHFPIEFVLSSAFMCNHHSPDKCYEGFLLCICGKSIFLFLTKNSVIRNSRSDFPPHIKIFVCTFCPYRTTLNSPKISRNVLCTYNNIPPQKKFGSSPKISLLYRT